jgi:hypothetical protein
MDKVHKLFKLLGDVQILRIFLVLSLFFLFCLFPGMAARYTSLGGPTDIEMQLTRGPEGWADLWQDYSGNIERGLHEYRTRLLYLDFLFPVIFAALLMSATALLTKGAGTGPDKGDLFLFVLPVLGGLCDWAENGMHFILLRGVKSIKDIRGIPPNSVRLSFAFTVLKFVLIIVPLGTAILVYVYRLFGRVRSS